MLIPDAFRTTKGRGGCTATGENMTDWSSAASAGGVAAHGVSDDDDVVARIMSMRGYGMSPVDPLA